MVRLIQTKLIPQRSTGPNMIREFFHVAIPYNSSDTVSTKLYRVLV